MCTPVKQYVQKQRMVIQKQQEMQRRESEARAYGGAPSHMMPVRAPRCALTLQVNDTAAR